MLKKYQLPTPCDLTVMENITWNAMQFAKEVHQGQVRKYTGSPYIEHLAEVAAYTQCFGESNESIAAAWLHDTIEDQDVSPNEIEHRFGRRVSRIVLELSDLETGKRTTRKAATVQRLARASKEAQTIKIADLLSNTKSIVQFDPEFARVYLKEKEALIEVLTKVRVDVWSLAREQIDMCNAQLRALDTSSNNCK